MIVLDTHIWVWWVHDSPKLSSATRTAIEAAEATGIGVSAISVWEVAKLVELQRLVLPCPAADRISQALAYPGIHLLELTPQICIESTQLPAPFHRDPADQIIVATARIMNAPLATADERIRNYAHVQLAPL